ncbi:MAG: ArsR/SmtB family transcription factor [Phycisphaerales bacterium JB065]
MNSTDEAIPKRDRVFHVRDPEHFEAIGSPVRLTVLEFFRSRGPMAVAELAELMGRPADGLYHHLKKLERAGVVRAVATRQRGKQIERVYDATADEYRLSENAEQFVRIWRLISSHAERNLAEGLAAGVTRFGGAGRNSTMRIETAQLDDAGAAEVLEHIEAIRAIFSRAREEPRGEQRVFTFLFQPVPSVLGGRRDGGRDSGRVSGKGGNGTRSKGNAGGRTPKNEAGTKSVRSGRKTQ